MQLACPSCGAPIGFGPASVWAVCASCGSTVVRQDRDLSLTGRMAELPDEMTPLQVGTEVEHGGTRFVLAGRVRMAWADGAWNEWYMLGDGTEAWLADAQGTLAVAFPQPAEAAPGLDPAQPPPLLHTVRVAGRDYRVTDVKQARCQGSEGELTFPAPQGRTTTYADMLGADGGFAGAEYGDEGLRLYAGHYVSLEALRPRNLRPIEGWAAPFPA